MTRLELEAFLKESGLGSGMASVNAVYLDDVYALPSRKDILQTFAAAFRTNLALLSAKQYRPETWDCDDYALLATSLFRVEHNLGYAGNAGVAFGFLGYLSLADFPPVRHAINFGVVKENGVYQLVFFEPQGPSEAVLSETELSSVQTIII